MIVARAGIAGAGLEVLALADGYLVRPEGSEGVGLVFRTAPCAFAYLDLLDGAPGAADGPLSGARSRLRVRFADLCGRLGDQGTPMRAIDDHARSDALRRAPRLH